MKSSKRRASRAPAAKPLSPAERDLLDLTRRFRLAVRLTVLVVLAALGDHIPGVPLAYIAPPRFWVWFQLVLSIPVVLWSGARIFRPALAAIFRFRADRSIPIALGVAALWIYSLVAALRPELFPLAYLDESLLPRPYFQTATVVVTLVLVTWLIEARARLRPAAAVESLHTFVPQSARRLRPDDNEEDARVAALEPGESVRVWVGEPVPLDGVVLAGRNQLDESKITGDPQLREVAPGDFVIGGAINREGGPLPIRIERGHGDHLVARVVRALQSALETRASMERLADRCAAWVVVVALLAAVLTFAVWARRDQDAAISLALLNAVAVLVVVAPGAFVVAARGPIATAIAQGARFGIVFREAAAIERLRDADTLVVSIARPIEEGDVATLRALKATGLRLVLWTVGGAEPPALPAELGVEVGPAPTSPEGIAAALEPLRAKKRVVAIAAADSSPAFAQADVGIALGSAFEGPTPTAGVNLVRGDLRGVLRARRLARAAVGLQKQGLLFVSGYTALALPLAVGVLRPYLGFLLDPMVAVAAAGWCSLVVVLNALRLRG